MANTPQIWFDSSIHFHFSILFYFQMFLVIQSMFFLYFYVCGLQECLVIKREKSLSMLDYLIIADVICV